MSQLPVSVPVPVPVPKVEKGYLNCLQFGAAHTNYQPAITYSKLTIGRLEKV